MSDFQFDTSGVVTIRDPMWRDHETWNTVRWSDLSPFMQGYVRRAKEEFRFLALWNASGPEYDWNYADLAPSTLAAMMADCERFRGRTSSQCERVGALFWKNRSAGFLSGDGWEPLTLQIHDDGLVYQEARS